MRTRMLSSARSRILGVAAFAAVGALVLAGCGPNPTLRVVPLPANSGSWAVAINNSGDVVGFYGATAAGGQRRAFLYDPKSNIATDISTIPVSEQFPDGGTMTDAVGINDSGIIVGSSDKDGPVAYDSVHGSWQTLPGCSEPNGTSNEALAITNDGLVACGSGVYDLSTHTFQPIVSQSGTNCLDVVGVNDSGKAIANCGDTSDSTGAFVIDLTTGEQTPIGVELAEPVVGVTSISDSGTVVGTTRSNTAIGQPFAYDVSGPTPVRVSLGLYDSLPVLTAVVSDHGIVAMSVQVPATSQQVLHYRIGTYNLATNAAGSYDDSQSLVILTAVNDSGQAAGMEGALPIPPGGETPNAFYGQLPVAG